MRRRRLGRWQVKMLDMIQKHQVCCSLAAVDTVGGRAKDWSRRYASRLKSAIAAHNKGIAINSPISSDYMILEYSGRVGKERCGFKLVLR